MTPWATAEVLELWKREGGRDTNHNYYCYYNNPAQSFTGENVILWVWLRT